MRNVRAAIDEVVAYAFKHGAATVESGQWIDSYETTRWANSAEPTPIEVSVESDRRGQVSVDAVMPNGNKVRVDIILGWVDEVRLWVPGRFGCADRWHGGEWRAVIEEQGAAT